MLLDIEVAKMKTEGSVLQCYFAYTLLTCASSVGALLQEIGSLGAL